MKLQMELQIELQNELQIGVSPLIMGSQIRILTWKV